MNKKGFTLAETLIAIAILLMVSGLMAGGIPAAINVYNKAVDAANAQIFMSTTMTAIRDELDCARDVRTSGTTVTYTDTNGYKCTMEVLSGDKNGIYVVKENPFKTENKYADFDNGTYSNSEVKNPLVSRSASVNKFYAVYTGVSINNDIITFTGLETKNKANGDKSMVNIGDYKVLIINAG